MMHLRFRLFSLLLAAAFLSTGLSARLAAQQPNDGSNFDSMLNLPEAPQPQFAASRNADGEQQPGQDLSAPPTPAQTGSSSSASQAPANETPVEKTQREKAAQQINEQEHQRVLGILPAFNTSYRSDAVSLTAKEKISVAFRSATDPITFAAAVFVAG